MSRRILVGFAAAAAVVVFGSAVVHAQGELPEPPPSPTPSNTNGGGTTPSPTPPAVADTVAPGAVSDLSAL